MAASDRADHHASGAASGGDDTTNALRLALLERLETALTTLFLKLNIIWPTLQKRKL